MTKEQKVLAKVFKDFMYNKSLGWDDIRNGDFDLGAKTGTLHKISKGTNVKPKTMGLVAEKLGIAYDKEYLEKYNVFTLIEKTGSDEG
jgi:hypothetical protein